ncbi:RmlC-like cupin domain-containing protein [Fusarium flagelliforme]|uniref:Quercetin-dioxygenase n=1 Tax=Fusarium flagelliforme TaxID=2675880 RepID=A0A395N3C3_9HYPO|nr:RmlC-like cupin domain-containing protein [Fusarium flagelliforme]KAH7193968.1 RmlC-like cupin domain-containing protein [Fusarium flagelliforme]RFN54440.1 quercetin -dioxygenase [Fusarium flagelliforme]
MRTSTLLVGLAALATAAPSTQSQPKSRSHPLVVDRAPDTPRPYMLPKGFGRAVSVGSQVYRLSVTGNASDGAFTLLQTNAPSSSELGVLPHIHKAHYENFYCTKGQFRLWAESNSSAQQGRQLTPGDYGAVPHNTKHTFQVLDPDTQMTGVIHPGGFEELFIALGEDFSSKTGTPFVPAALNDSSSGTDPNVITALESFDVFAQLDFEPRQDFLNGQAGGSSQWHNDSNTLAVDSNTPNFIAKNRGPKYLNNIGGTYQLIAPLATKDQTGSNFTMGTVTLSHRLEGTRAINTKLRESVAFQLEEGKLSISIDGYEAMELIQGDVVFVPGNTSFTYYAMVPFTKFLYVSGGKDGFDQTLMEGAKTWDYATYPVA